ncbi:MAG TPA: hypothetical protein DEQ28_07150 [Clostridiales bacterium]|nr:hypothetical protein [Clostridiales bacterium]
MIVGVDLGYGFVKAVNEQDDKIVFPAVIASGKERSWGKLFDRVPDDYFVTVRPESGSPEEYFVGRLAESSGHVVSRAFDSQKAGHPTERVLLLTALGLLAGDGPCVLALGTPLQQYTPAAVADLQRTYSGLTADVEVRSSEVRRTRVQVARVSVLPQGAAVLLGLLADRDGRVHLGDVLRFGGLVGFVDVGYRTTDYLLLEVSPQGRVLPLYEMSGTLDLGMVDVVKKLRDQVQDRVSGSSVDLVAVNRAWHETRLFYWSGRDYDLGELGRLDMEQVARAIRDRLVQAWSNRLPQVRFLFLAGGGAPDVQPYFDGFGGLQCRQIMWPQEANARGYMLVTRSGAPGAARSQEGFPVS